MHPILLFLIYDYRLAQRTSNSRQSMSVVVIASFDQPASKCPLAVADVCRHTCWREVYRFRQSGRWMCVGPQCMADTNARFYFKAPVGQVWCLSRKRFHSFVILVDVASVCCTSPAGSGHCLLNQLCCLLCILVVEGAELLVFVVLISNLMMVYIYLRDHLYNFLFISHCFIKNADVG